MVDQLPELRTPRLVLRWLADADVPDLFRLYSDPQVMRYWGSTMGEPAEVQAMLTRVRKGIAEGSCYEWGLARLDDDRVIGRFTFWSVHADSRRAEIGFAMARDAWGQGYMSEAATAALECAFGDGPEQLGLMRIEADVDPRNGASLRMLEGLGFQREGLARERWRVGGEVQDSVMLGLLRRDWEARPR